MTRQLHKLALTLVATVAIVVVMVVACNNLHLAKPRLTVAKSGVGKIRHVTYSVIALRSTVCLRVGKRLVCYRDPVTANLLLEVLYFGVGSWVNYMYIDKNLCLKLANGTCIYLPSGERYQVPIGQQVCDSPSNLEKKLLFELATYVPLKSIPPSVTSDLAVVVGNATCTLTDNRLLCSKVTVSGQVIAVKYLNATTIEVEAIIPPANYTGYYIREIALAYPVQSTYLLLTHDFLPSPIPLNATVYAYIFITANKFIIPLVGALLFNGTSPSGNLYYKFGWYRCTGYYDYPIVFTYQGSDVYGFTACITTGYSSESSDIVVGLKLHLTNGTTVSASESTAVLSMVIKNISNTLVGILGTISGKCSQALSITEVTFYKVIKHIHVHYGVAGYGTYTYDIYNTPNITLTIPLAQTYTIPCQNGIYTLNLIIKLKAG